jgi:hypothetical protein
MALEPETIDLDGLPRTIGGGLKREPVEELLKRVQWEYSQLYYEHKRLKAELEQLGGAKSALLAEGQPTGATSAAEPPGTPGRTSTASRSDAAKAARGPEDVPVAQPGPDQPVARAPRKELDDLARLVLVAVHRASVELRESSRRDCELMLKKTRERAVDLERSFERTNARRTAELGELERDFERTKEKRTAELVELEEMLREIRGQMQATLEVLIPVHPDPDPDPEKEVDPDETEGVTVLRPAEAPAHNADSDGETPRAAGHTEFEAAS